MPQTRNCSRAALPHGLPLFTAIRKALWLSQRAEKAIASRVATLLIPQNPECSASITWWMRATLRSPWQTFHIAVDIILLLSLRSGGGGAAIGLDAPGDANSATVLSKPRFPTSRLRGTRYASGTQFVVSATGRLTLLFPPQSWSQSVVLGASQLSSPLRIYLELTSIRVFRAVTCMWTPSICSTVSRQPHAPPSLTCQVVARRGSKALSLEKRVC